MLQSLYFTILNYSQLEFYSILLGLYFFSHINSSCKVERHRVFENMVLMEISGYEREAWQVDEENYIVRSFTVRELFSLDDSGQTKDWCDM